MINDSDLTKPMAVRGPDVAPAEAGMRTTSLKALSPDIKALRSSCKNAVAVAAGTLAQRDLWRRQLSIMCRIANPVCKWRGKSVQQMRSATEAKDWLVLQFKEGFLKCESQILGELLSRNVLEEAGFFGFLSLPSACSMLSWIMTTSSASRCQRVMDAAGSARSLTVTTCFE